jgi:hypothetical protein
VIACLPLDPRFAGSNPDDGFLTVIKFRSTTSFGVEVKSSGPCRKFTACERTLQWPRGLRRGSWPVGCWDRGFESRLSHGCLSASFYVMLSCVGRGLATG